MKKKVRKKNVGKVQRALCHPGGQGQTVDLLDEQLILLGGKQQSGKFEYKSIHQPRKGLLGMTYSREVSPIGKSPIKHTSHSYGNQLLTIGGEEESKAKLSNSVWTRLELLWKNGSEFSRYVKGGCRVKLEKDIFLLIGGIEIGGSKGEMKTVLRMNITDETMEELPPIQKNRAFHSCEVSERRVLISGGKKGKYVMDDEIYSLWTNESIVLKTSKSLRRHQHHLLALGSTIYAFGGTKENGLPTDQVEKFDWETNSWVVHDHSLLSKDTKNLAITAFPRSAVDCHLGCSCGQANKSEDLRIINGIEAQVFFITFAQYSKRCRK